MVTILKIMKICLRKVQMMNDYELQFKEPGNSLNKRKEK
jgi:hypothetical protein